jgi:DNA invertase Pin-like site-specific DNA recombinase
MLYSYRRASTFEQAASLTEQLRKNTVIASFRCESLALEFRDFCDEGVSGSVPLSQRSAGREMMEIARKGDCLIITKLDRMFRSARDALVMRDEFEDRGIDLIIGDFSTNPVTSDIWAKCFFGLMAQVADLERMLIRERMRDGRKAKKAKGGHIAGHAPYGFKAVGRGKEAMLVECPEEMEIIQLARKYKSYRIGAGEIMRKINRTGFRSRAGTEFQLVQIRRILASDRVPNG